MGFMDRVRRGWNAFRNNRDPTFTEPYMGGAYFYRPDRVHFSRTNGRSIVNSLYNRIALDVSSLSFRHVNLDANDRFIECRSSKLDYCLSTEANIDQTSRAFIQDIVMSTIDEGVIAVCPIDTDHDPNARIPFSMLATRCMWFVPKTMLRLSLLLSVLKFR